MFNFDVFYAQQCISKRPRRECVRLNPGTKLTSSSALYYYDLSDVIRTQHGGGENIAYSFIT